MLLIVILSINIWLAAAQNSCNMLCNCVNNACTTCYAGFEASSIPMSAQNQCDCPDGFYLQQEICQFCPTNCMKCDSLSVCTQCYLGYQLKSGQCKHEKYIEQQTWLSYQVCKDFNIQSDGSYSVYGFQIIGESGTLNADFIDCSQLTFPLPNQRKEILKFQKSSAITISRKQYGLPFHQWARITMAYVVLDSWNGQQLVVSLQGTDAMVNINYDNSQRHIDVCGGPEPDNLGRIDVQINTESQELELRIQLVANKALGIKQIIYEVGTCPRNCLSCLGPQKCLECQSYFQLVDGVCSCDTQLSYPVHYGCLEKCSEEKLFLNGSLDRCVLCQLYMPHCKSCSSFVKCTKCYTNAFLYEDKCLTQCSRGTYPEFNSNGNICQKCPQGCLSCASVSVCLQCNSSKFNDGGQCVDACTNGALASNSRICKQNNQCLPGCASCQNNQCTSCHHPLIFSSAQCLETCPLSTYYDVSSIKCQPCPNNCISCISSSICLICSFDHILRSGNCVIYNTDCVDGKYFDARVGNGKCLDCPSGCKTCYKGLCYTCLSGYYLDNGECLTVCSQQKEVLVANTQKCLWKSPLCSTYNSTNVGQCEQCLTLRYPLYKQQNKMCSSKCSNGKINNIVTLACEDSCISNCQICIDSQNCIKCKSGFILDETKKCISSCSQGLVSDSYQCIECQSNCQQCNIAGLCTSWISQPDIDCSTISSTCKKCFKTGQQICVQCDKTTFLQSSSCVSTCNEGTFPDETSRQCRLCMPLCSSCVHVNDCQSCISGFYLHNNNCMKQCLSGYYIDSETSSCQKCSPSCKTCFGPKQFQCLTCFFDHKLDHTQCVSNCPIHRYSDPYSHCDWCHQSCKTCFGPADFQCIQCQSDFYVYNGECFSECPAATYLYNPVIRQCKQCSWGCAVCISSTQCSICYGGYYFHNGQCMNICPPRTYFNSQSQCSNCQDSHCSVCSVNSCSICQHGYHLYKGGCVSSCEQGLYVLDSYFYSECRECPSTCLTCTASYSCQTCADGYYLLNNRCVNYCPSSQFFDVTLKRCEPCLSNCELCYQQASCTQCQSGLYSHQNSCLPQCPQETYPVSTGADGECRPCSATCQSCSSFYQCITCKTIDYVLLNGMCIENSTDPYTCTIPNCQFCPLAQSCLDCGDNFYLLNSQCLSSCPDKYYNQANHCYPCRVNCNNCTSDRCIQCATNYYLYLGVCVHQCPLGFYQDNGKCIRCTNNCQLCTSSSTCTNCVLPSIMLNGACITACPASTYYSIQANECLNCGQYCQICHSFSQCITCAPSYYLSPTTGKCQQICPRGTYINTLSNQCENCLFQCQSCDSQNYCTICRDGFYLYQGVCKRICLEGNYADHQKGTCESCSSQCLTCISEATTCITCHEGSFSFNQQCVLICPEGTYEHITNRICLPCSSYCIQCQSFQQCTQCDLDLLLFNQQCVNQCPEGYYSQNGICTKCQSPCQTCHGRSQYQCNTCLADFYYFNNRCIEDCPLGYYSNSEHLSCYQCPSACLQCDIFSECTVCFSGNAPVNGDCDPDVTCTTQQINCDYCSADGCEHCFDGFYLQNNACVEICANGTYANQLTGTCSDCSSNCLTCTKLNQCTLCQPTFVSYLGKCYDSCPDGTVLSENNICTVDPCIFYNEGTQNCEECNRPYYLHENQCVSQCPVGTYISPLQCETCPINCLRCSSSSSCEQCQQPFNLYNERCLAQCPSTTYHTQQSNVCILCKQHCLLCQSTSGQCSRCQFGYYEANGVCVRSCTSGTYMNTNTGSCQECSVHCSTCLSALSCNNCQSSYHLLNGQCISHCPQTYYEESGVCNLCSDNCLICNTNACTECKEYYYLYEGFCQSSCPSGTYPHLQTQQCSQCSTDCQKCSSAKQCIQCASDRVLYNLQCLTECPSGYFIPPNNNICTLCDTSCFSCTEIADKCTQCFPGYTLIGDYCRRLCQSNQYRDDNGDCQNCLSRCTVCRGPNPNQCTECATGYTLKDNRCIVTCPQQYYALNGVCQPCVSYCISCTSAGCQQCEDQRFLLTVGNMKTCVINCPSGTFRNNVDSICQTCPAICLTCSSVTDCVTCQKNMYLTPTKSCQSSCPTGSFADSNKVCIQCSGNCNICLDTDTCQQCLLGFLLHNGQCVLNCPVGTYISSINCVQCSQQYCLSCSGPSDTQCTTCQQSYILKGKCYIQCPQNYSPLDGRCVLDIEPVPCGDYILNSVCYEYCPPHYYENDVDKTCQQCAQNCIVCTDANNCQMCRGGMILYNGLCVSLCPTGFTQINGICIPCSDQYCQVCYTSPVQCTDCQDGYNLHAGQCVQNCPKGLYADNQNCQICSIHCLTCTSSTTCLTCSNTAYSPPNCQDQTCSTNQFTNSQNQCQTCHTICLTCYESQSDKCESCSPPLILISGQCRSSCPPGYFYLASNQICQPCSTHCKICSDATSCTSCFDNFILFNNQCYQQCQSMSTPQRGYTTSATQGCALCSQNCAKCTPNQCQTCANTYNLYNEQCHSECPSGFYSYSYICEPCNLNCAKCTSFDSCSQCKQDMFILNNRCVLTCPQKTYPDNGMCLNCTNPRCVQCNAQNQCSMCETPFLVANNVCDLCISGYIYQPTAQTCQQCNQTCLTCSINQETCSECHPGYLLFNGKCRVTCPVGHYALNGQCSTCNQENCSLCISTQCFFCRSGYFMNSNKECVPDCPLGFYQVPTTRICGKCASNCQQCTVNECQVCAASYILYHSNCISNCPTGTFATTDMPIHCAHCSTGCRQCQSQNTCTLCRSDYQLQNSACIQIICLTGSLLLSDGTCVASCPSATIYNPATLLCENCPSLCTVCNLDGQCSACQTDKFLYVKLCYEICPQKTFNDTATTCQICPELCEDCDSLTQCTSCITQHYLHEGQCLDNCPPKYFNDNNICSACSDNCQKCGSEIQCIQCQLSHYLHVDECVLTCPDKTFVSDRRCIDCSQSCLTCTNLTTCQSCITDYFLSQTNECVSGCGVGKYEAANNICQPCTTQKCKTCSQTQCYQCLTPNYHYTDLQNVDHCVLQCPEGYYKDEDAKSCVICVDPCHLCSSATECSQCIQNYFLYQSQCNTQCPTDTFRVSGVCYDCSNNCALCVDAQSCSDCQGDYKLVKISNTRSNCQQNCPVRFYANDDNICNACGANCRRCVNQDQCAQCISTDYSLVNLQCIPKDCVNCEICDQNQCTKCNEGFYLLEGRCYQQCPNPYYQQDPQRTCQLCMQHCLQCPNATICDVCEDGFNFTVPINQCVDEAYLQFGFFSNMSGFTENITEVVTSIYLGTSVGPLVFGQMTTTYFNIELCQFVLFHSTASGGNQQVQKFLDSLQGMSLTLSGNTNNTTSRRRMLTSELERPQAFLAANALIFVLAGVFMGIYGAIYLFQRNLDSCCGSCPRLFFYVNQICIFMQKRFLWIYFDFVVWLAYIPFLYFALKQLINFSFGSFLQGLSSLLSIAVIATFPLYPAFIGYLIHKHYNALVKQDDALIEMSLYPFITKVKRPTTVVPQDQPLKAYLTFENFRLLVDAIKYFRKFIFVLIIVVSTQTPIVTLSILISLNVLFIIYLFVFRPRLMPYLALDLVIQFFLLGFEIFMLVYLLHNGQKTSAMSIVAHAIGFITANLSLVIAIILNLFAYYKIIMCLRQLYLHLKMKAEQKDKQQLKGQDDIDQISEHKDRDNKSQANFSGRHRKDNEDTEYDIDNSQLKGLIKDKQIYKYKNKDGTYTDEDGLPKLLSVRNKNRKNKAIKDKQLGYDKKKNSDSLTDQDEQPRYSDLLKKNKQIFYDHQGNIIVVDEEQLPGLKNSKKKKNNKKKVEEIEEFPSNMNLLDKQMNKLKNGNRKNSDSLTDQDEQPRFSNLIKKNKQIFYDHQGNVVVVDEEQLPGLKQSKIKHKNKKKGEEKQEDSSNLFDKQIDPNTPFRRRKNSDSLTDEDEQPKFSDLIKNNKQIFYDHQGNAIVVGNEEQLPGLKQTKKKHKNKKANDVDPNNFFDKQIDPNTPLRKKKKSDEMTQSDGDYSETNSNIMKDKQLFGKRLKLKNQQSKGEQIPDLKPSLIQKNVKKINKNKHHQTDSDQISLSNSHVSEDKLIGDGKLIQKSKKHQRKGHSDEIIIADGVLKDVSKDKYKRGNLERIQSRHQEQDIDELGFKNTNQNYKSKQSQLKQAQFKQHKNNLKGKKNNNDQNILQQANFKERNPKHKHKQQKLQDSQQIPQGQVMSHKINKKTSKQPQQFEEGIQGGKMVDKGKNKFKRNMIHEQGADDLQLNNKQKLQKRNSDLLDDYEIGDYVPQQDRIQHGKGKNNKKYRQDNQPVDQYYSSPDKNNKNKGKFRDGDNECSNDEYEEIKRKNKDQTIGLSPDRANKVFQSAEFSDRPQSKAQRPRSRGNLSVKESDSESMGQDSASVRKRRQSAVKKLRKKQGGLDLNEASQYSEDSDYGGRGTKTKVHKKKREKSGVLKINEGKDNNDLEEMQL